MFQKISQINNDFYSNSAFGEDFSRTRTDYFWSGWQEVLAVINTNFYQKPIKILDLGCGNGRFLDFLESKNVAIDSYLGLDFSEYLIQTATQKNYKLGKFAKFQCIDFITKLDSLDLLNYDLVCLFGVMHHIFGEQNRLELINKIKQHLEPNGVLVFSTWQFDTKKESKILDTKSQEAKMFFDKYKFNQSQLETGDYFLRWSGNSGVFRYCHLYTEKEVLKLIYHTGFEIITSFTENNNGNNTNLYWVLKPK